MPFKGMPIEPMQFCVALHRKVRIRLHPSAVFVCGIIMCTISQLKVLDTSVHIVLSATRVVRNQCLSHILRYCLIHAAKMRISECRARSTFGRLFPEGLKKLVWAMPSRKATGRRALLGNASSHEFTSAKVRQSPETALTQFSGDFTKFGKNNHASLVGVRPYSPTVAYWF